MRKPNGNTTCIFWALPLAALASLPPLPGYAQLVVSDTLTGASSSYGWTTTGGACLTAGDGSSSTIPACKGLAYYSGKNQVGGVSGILPDPIGQGALRLTNGDTTINGSNGNNDTGSVISTSPFPTNQGIQVTFSTATYGGNGFRNSRGEASGADGIAFFLMDGSKQPLPGAYGGSLGYSCANGKNPADGVDGGYLGVAMDEFGNFSNKGDSTSDGNGPNPGTIVVRGSGSITAKALKSAYPKYYPNSLTAADALKAVQNTCKTGYLQNWSGRTITDANGSRITHTSSTTEKVRDYNLIGAPKTITGTTIYNQQGIAKPLREDANIFTYGLSITQDGLLSLSYSVNGGATTPVITKQSITTANGPLPPKFLFGFTSGTGGGSNVHEILCFKAAQINVASNSAGTNVQESSRVKAGSQVYLAFYHPVNSWGQLTASNLVADASGNVSISSTANWDANCVLTGGACTATGGATTVQGPTSRKILSWNGASGIPLQYASLSSTQQKSLGVTDDESTKRIAFLRGDRSDEITSSGIGEFRRRDGVLGDIMNSSPAWVGLPSSNYSAFGMDRLMNKAIPEFGLPYKTFIRNYATRAHIVYVGANDGMLHGFRAGANDASGVFSTQNTPNDGQEVLAYMPAAVVGSIHPSNATLDFSSPQYAHNNYVNATPAMADLYYSGAWHTWLVGGLGGGGNATGTINDTASTANGVLYALDITDPARFAETNASDLVIGEWDSSSVTCSNDSNTNKCNASLGSVYGTPIIRKLHDGNWAVIFGNGRNSSTGTAGIFVMSVDYKTGAKTFRFLDTGMKSTTSKNGIDYVSSADLDADHVTDYLYAGDLQGNVWRFDLTNSDSAKWIADNRPMFATDTGQPITTRLTVNSLLQASGPSRVVIAFGTGKQSPQTLTSGASYASGPQALYGIWDWNLSSWNAMSGVTYASLAAPQSYSSAHLQSQTMTTFNGPSGGDISGYRTVSQNPVCWKGTPACTASNSHFGWKLILPSSAGEQVIYNPTLAYGTLLINTTIPSVNQTLSCASQPASGYTMAISPETGGAPASSFFGTAAKDAGLVTSGSAVIAGLGLNATGSPSIVTASGKPVLVQQTASGSGVVTKVDPPNGLTGRLTWVKLR